MPRAEAGFSGGLPLFECSSFGLASSKTCLYKKTRTQQFSGVWSSRCSHTFRALFNHAKFIFHVLYVHLTLIFAPCWQAKTDSPVNEGREHCMGNSNSWDVTASSPSSSRCCHENALGEFACRLQSGTQSRLLYLFHTHVSWLRIPSINSPHLTF